MSVAQDRGALQGRGVCVGCKRGGVEVARIANQGLRWFPYRHKFRQGDDCKAPWLADESNKRLDKAGVPTWKQKGRRPASFKLPAQNAACLVSERLATTLVSWEEDHTLG